MRLEGRKKAAALRPQNCLSAVPGSADVCVCEQHLQPHGKYVSHS